MSKTTFAFGTTAAIGVNIDSPLSNNDLSFSGSHLLFGVGTIVNGLNLISVDGSETYHQAYGQTDSQDAVVVGANSFGWLPTLSRLTSFNGVTWDRLRSDGSTTDAVAGDTAGVLKVFATMRAFNGTNWDRVRTGSPTADPGNVGVAAAQIHVSDGTNIRRVNSGLADAASASLMVPSPGWVFNGTNWDRVRSGTATGSVLVNNPTAANFLAQVSGTVTANIGTTNGLALDATLTGGTQKTKIVDTGGTNVASVSAAGAIKVDASSVPVPVTDNSGSLTVDAPVGTPVASRLSDGSAFLTTTGGRLSVDASGVAVPVTDNGGSLTVDGTVTANQGTANTAANAWPNKITDGTNTAAVKAASTAVAAADPALAVGLHPSSPLPAGSNTIGALTANQSVNLAQVAGTTTSTGSRVTDAGVQSTFQAAPTAANILVGHVAQTATTAAAIVITIPINRTWVGTITITCDVAEAAAGTVAGQALGTVATTGTSATPAAGTVATCEARCGANAASGLVGTQGANSITVPMVVSAGASALATITLASTQAGTASRVACIASGYLI